MKINWTKAVLIGTAMAWFTAKVVVVAWQLGAGN